MDFGSLENRRVRADLNEVFKIVIYQVRSFFWTG